MGAGEVVMGAGEVVIGAGDVVMGVGLGDVCVGVGVADVSVGVGLADVSVGVGEGVVYAQLLFQIACPEAPQLYPGNELPDGSSVNGGMMSPQPVVRPGAKTGPV
jgi:hypothetical protein